MDSLNAQENEDILPTRTAKEPTETPEFKAWFGNSKVVDPNGNPTPIFHGSKADFTSFDYQFIGKGNDQEGPGFYFTSDIKDASIYSNEEGKIYEVYLRIENPVPLEGEVDRYELEKLALMAVGLKDEEELYDLADSDEYWETNLSDWGEHPVSAYHSLIESVYSSYHSEPHQAFQQMWVDAFGFDSIPYLKAMMKLGYDGVIVSRGHTTHYITFSPNQAKAVVSEGFSETDDMYKEDRLPKLGL
jgi:hypothetical protein